MEPPKNHAYQGGSSSQNTPAPRLKFVKVVLPPSDRAVKKKPATRTTSKKRKSPCVPSSSNQNPGGPKENPSLESMTSKKGKSPFAPSSSNQNPGEPMENPSLESMKQDLFYMLSRLEKEGDKVEPTLRSHLDTGIHDLLKRIEIKEQSSARHNSG